MSEQFWKDMKKEAEIRRNEGYRNAFNNPFYALKNVGFQNQSGLAAVMTEEQRKRRTAKLDETRPLKGSFRDYICDIDVSSPCECIDNWPLHLFKHQTQGVDIDQFKEDCKGIDNEERRI